METGMSTTRFVISVVIILGCFTVLYPRFFHPIALKIFGLSPPPKTQNDHAIPRQPNMPPGREFPTRGADDIKSHMRPGPHPGMRAAAEMNSQQQQRGSGRGGVMTAVLPMYAVGITVYLVYTLVKVFNKKGNYEKERESRLGRNRRHSDPGIKEQVDRPMSREDRVQEFMESSQRLSELEELLNKADDKHIDDEDMRELQRRLEETELQMSRIMQAMQTVTQKVSNVATDAVVQPSTTGNDENKDDKSSTDSSPDISSFEVINKKSEKSSDSSPDVETMKASDVPSQDTDVSEQKNSDLLSDINVKKENEAEETEPAEDIVMDGQKDEEESEDKNVRKRKTRVVESD